MSAGKGSSPRNCFSAAYKNNYDEIFGKKNQNLVPVYRIGYRVTGDKVVRYLFFRDCKNEEEAIKRFSAFHDEKTHTIVSSELFST